MLPTLTRDRDSTEYLTYSFDTFTLANGEAVAPPTAYQLALTPLSEYHQPDRPEPTWHDAPWLATNLTRGDYYVRLRFTDTPEQPARTVGILLVL